MTSSEVLTKPICSLDEAQTIAAQHFDIVGEAYELPGERDKNFLIDGSNKFVLKISNPNTKLPILEVENAAIGIVEAIESIESPWVVKSISGSSIVKVNLASGQTCFARCISFLPGIPLAKFQPHTPALLAAIGRSLGEVDVELSALNSCLAAKRDLKWDLANAPEVVKLHLPLFHGDSEKQPVLEHFLQLHEVIKDRVDDLADSVIHNDANDYNILVHQGSEDLVLVSLIDFGDLVYSKTIYDLAICGAYVVLGKSNPVEALKALTSGYYQSRELSGNELSVLFPLVCLRLCQSVCIAAEQRSLVPDNEYLSITEQPAWEALKVLQGIDSLVVHLELSDVCQTSNASNTKSRSVGPMLPDEILRERRRLVAPSLSLAYSKPLTIVRGRGQYLFDSQDVTYLDCVNNVCHVGHCHPKVVKAANDQMAMLNTNTRYLHENIVRYAKRLTETLPQPLEVCFFVNSGSEANDLAIRLAQTRTGLRGVAVIDHAYHGHTNALIEISPYKFDHIGGAGKSDHVHVLTCPDGFRGPYKYGQAEYDSRYAAEAVEVIESVTASGNPIGAFFAESILSCGGQIVLPPGYLETIYRAVRKAGGICIADEVQVGFGRVGSKFWGFELQDVVPDIVTMGKPIGNGHPLAAVVTTREIADSFNNGMEYFNTFGGNPVSSAVGMAVLDVIEDEDLQRHALETGEFLIEGFRQLQAKYTRIGDVRGSGLFLGVEFVNEDGEPDSSFATKLVERMKEKRILLSTDGPCNNVIKFKPPMVFSCADAERLIATMDRETGVLLGR